MYKYLAIMFSLVFTFSCGKNADEALQEAILSANIALGKLDCQTAIDILENHGRVYTDAHYLKTLASSYACRAGYNTPTFFTSDLALTATPSPLGGMTKYSTSLTIFQNPLENDPVFIDLQTAINLLLYAGNIASTTEPTVAERAKHFTSDDAGEINSELLFMLLVQYGRLMKIYANASATGVKGAGGAGNVCFTKYANAPAGVQSAIASQAGACKVTTSSHAQLDPATVAAATRKRRLCHGVVLLNGIFDVLPGVISAASGGSLAVISGLVAAIPIARSALTTAYPGIGQVLTTVNQIACEDNSITPLADIESYYGIIVEGVIN